MSIRFEQVTKRYHGAPVVNDVTLEVASGEFFVLLGPSGSGKSTLLRALAGLAPIDHGRISLGGRDVTHLPARERGVGFVFQHYALFRHMSVAENIEFALRVRGVAAAQRRSRRAELLRLVALEGLDERKPGQLSGGQQQRVAVARALAHEPAVLVLDEPFGALDAVIRVELRDTVREIQRRLGTTTILVTHDQEEAFALADRIGVMHMGRLLECGEPERLYRHPATRFVAAFLGAANLLLAERTGAGLRFGRELVVPTGVHAAADAALRSEAVTVVRPEDIEIADAPERLASPLLGNAHVQSLVFAGSIERLAVQLTAEVDLRAAVGGEASAAGPLRLDVVRTISEHANLPLAPGRRVALGLRRFHVLPTPISSIVLAVDDPVLAQSLRTAPVVHQLLASMRPRVVDDADAGAGLLVVNGEPARIGEAARRFAGRASAILCVPPQAQLPRRAQLLCASEAARPTALGALASVLRHLPVEATYVAVQSPGAPRAEVTASFRRLLDARAELLAAHGLDVRTEVHIGELASWLEGLVAAPEPTLLVVGIDIPPADLEAQLLGPLAPLFRPGLRIPLLLTLASPSRADRSAAAAHSDTAGTSAAAAAATSAATSAASVRPPQPAAS